jgi:hypothetical protein
MSYRVNISVREKWKEKGVMDILEQWSKQDGGYSNKICEAVLEKFGRELVTIGSSN